MEGLRGELILNLTPIWLDLAGLGRSDDRRNHRLDGHFRELKSAVVPYFIFPCFPPLAASFVTWLSM